MWSTAYKHRSAVRVVLCETRRPTNDKMHVAVIGPAGFGGSHVCKELLNRGHTVTGISRSPEKVGKHKDYEPKPLDLGTASISDVVKAFQSIDVVINAYNPPGGPTMYSTRHHETDETKMQETDILQRPSSRQHVRW